MPREIHDHYFREAKREGYLSRAAYKLLEIDDRRQILKRGDRVLDCGAAPGSWLQVAAKRVGDAGIVVGIDLQPIGRTLDTANVRFIQGDLMEIPADELRGAMASETAVRQVTDQDRFDVMLSDMAPSTTGNRSMDHHRSARLAETVLDRCGDLLRRGGCVIIKVFEGETYPALLERAGEMFESAKGFTPKASRQESTEIYLIGKGFRGADAPATGRAASDDASLPTRRPSTGWGSKT